MMGKLAQKTLSLPVEKFISTGSAGKLTGGFLAQELFGKKKDPIQAPTVEGPPPMPLPDDADVQAAKKRSLLTQKSRSGRISTIFSQGEGLGG